MHVRTAIRIQKKKRKREIVPEQSSSLPFGLLYTAFTSGQTAPSQRHSLLNVSSVMYCQLV